MINQTGSRLAKCGTKLANGYSVLPITQMLASPLLSPILRCDFFMALLSLLYILSLSLSLSLLSLGLAPASNGYWFVSSVRCIFPARVAARSRTACLTVFCSPRCLPIVTSVREFTVGQQLCHLFVS